MCGEELRGTCREGRRVGCGLRGLVLELGGRGCRRGGGRVLESLFFIEVFRELVVGRLVFVLVVGFFELVESLA